MASKVNFATCHISSSSSCSSLCSSPGLCRANTNSPSLALMHRSGMFTSLKLEISLGCRAATQSLSAWNLDGNGSLEQIPANGKPKVSHFTTADLYDCNMHLADKAELRVLQPIFQIYGQRRKFAGPVVTLMVSEDNVLIHEVLDTPGNGRVFVIDAGGQMKRALVGGIIAEKAQKNGWAGIVLNGCIRDVDDINAMDMGVRALASLPTKPRKLHFGLKHVPVNIGGVLIHEEEWLYADADGVLVSQSQIFM